MPEQRSAKSAWKPQRDAVTGELLLTEPALVIRVRDERIDRVPTPTQRRNGEAIETTPIPRVIDTAQPYPDGKLGGKRWHPEFTRYLGNRRTKAIEDADREVGEWWHGDYAQRRVLKGFVAKYGSERGARVWQLVLAVLDDPDALCDVADVAGVTPHWLARQRSHAYRFAFAKESAA